MTNEEAAREQQAPEPMPTPSAESSGTAPPGLTAGPLRMGIAGVLAGLLAWQLLHWSYPFFDEPIVEQENPVTPTERDQERMGIVRDATNRKNVATAGLLIGALAALLFAGLEGVRQGRLVRTIVITGVTVVLAACLGGIGGYYSMKFQRTFWFHPSFTPLKRELCIQAIFWLPIAASIGAGTGIYARRLSMWLGTVIQSILGAVLFVIVYVPLAGIAFPTDYAEITIPQSSANTAVWAVLALSLMGLMLGLSRGRRPASAASSNST